MMKLKKRRRITPDDKAGWILIAPFMLITFFFIILPVLANVFLSFTEYNLRSITFVGFNNFAYMLKDKMLHISLWNSLLFTLFNLPVSMALGLGIAIMLKNKIFGLRFFRTSIYIPYVTSMVAAALVWFYMFNPTNGIFNLIVKAMGLTPVNWLFERGYAMFAIIIVTIWKSVGYLMAIYLSGLQAIPEYLYEAAQIDGANGFRKFWNITLPMLRPTTFFLTITGFINSFRVFEQVKILTNGGPMNSTTTIVHQIYNRAFVDMKFGYAAAEAILLLLIILTFTLFNFKHGNQGHDLEAS